MGGKKVKMKQTYFYLTLMESLTRNEKNTIAKLQEEDENLNSLISTVPLRKNIIQRNLKQTKVKELT